MDLLKTLLIYMVVLVSSAAQLSPEITPIPPGAVATPVPIVTASPVPTSAPTTIPTPSPVVYSTLRLNDQGENVRKLQRRLIELGYLNDSADGVYGQKTKRAVERFQLYNDLSVDGIAGRNTLAKLYDDPNIVIAPVDITPTPTPHITSTPAISVRVPVYYLSSNGDLLYSDSISCAYGLNTIYANDTYVPSGYTLTSTRRVTVTVSVNGIASPKSISYKYLATIITAAPTTVPTDTPAPGVVLVPVIYADENGIVLYNETVPCTIGGNMIYYNTALAPEGYTLTSSDRVNVQVSGDGTAIPDIVYFTISAPVIPTATQIITPAPTPTATKTAAPTPTPTTTLHPTDAPTPAPEITNTLPKYQKTKFSEEQPVYSGPGNTYYRADGGNAAVSAGSPVRVYGTEGKWLLMGYELADGGYRIGYTDRSALPPDLIVPDLDFSNTNIIISDSANLTDDPVINHGVLCQIATGTHITYLCMLDSDHDNAYIEFYSEDLGANVRGFIPSSFLFP